MIRKFTQNPPSSIRIDFWGHSLNKTPEMFPSVLVEGMIVPFKIPSCNANYVLSYRICPGESGQLVVSRTLIMFNCHFTTGRVLADASLFISCAMSLAVFDITKYSKDGVVVEPVVEQKTGTIR